MVTDLGVEIPSDLEDQALQTFDKLLEEDEILFETPRTDTVNINGIQKSEITVDISGIPFTHFVVRLPNEASADYVFQQYERLLNETRKAFLAAGGGSDYNLILVREWLALVPRRSKGRGEVMFNAANIAGLMWTKDDDFKERIMRMLPGGLAELGIPRV
ncbi:MAG: hypothetical protein Q9212_005250 [Teloschistes hypoglaucus]